MWGRFQTAATVEGGMLAALYVLPSSGVGDDKCLLVLGGGLLVLAISILSLKDHSDASRHLKRIKQYETVTPLPPSKWPGWLSGRVLMILAMLILNIFNGVL